jgi:hypothetical protein
MISVFVLFGSIWFGGCGSHKVTEPEARYRATARFEHLCTFPYSTTPMKLYYHTNEFIEPTLNVGWGD